MSTSEVKNETVKSCITSNFLPAILREYKSGWIIEYYVENPIRLHKVCHGNVQRQSKTTYYTNKL